jgi:hypothetical protein
MVVVPVMPGGPWILGLNATEGKRTESALVMQGQRDMSILLQPGVELLAKKGDYHIDTKGSEGWRTLLSLHDCHNITIFGWGAKMRMWKADYSNPVLYNHSEFRGGMGVWSSSQITILGLNISSTGRRGPQCHSEKKLLSL